MNFEFQIFKKGLFCDNTFDRTNVFNRNVRKDFAKVFKKKFTALCVLCVKPLRNLRLRNSCEIFKTRLFIKL
jgi:hypothetical protein